MPAPLFPDSLLHQIRRTGVLATLIIDDPEHAVPLARALAAGGVTGLEITLRTATALESLRRIRAEVPEVTIGAGTILTPRQANECLEAGAAFGVSPGMNLHVVEEAQRIGLPFAPGVCTPSEIEQALELDCTLLKFFPSEPSGGLSFLRAVAAPYMHLGVQFIPLGGIDPNNAGRYLAEPFIAAIGGSWLAPRDAVQGQEWDAITATAHQASEIVQRVRGMSG